MAHDDEWLLKKILKLLDSSLNDIYLHLDRKFDVNVNEIKNNVKLSKIYCIPRMDIKWGGVEQVKCELSLLKCAIQNGPYKYYHLLSGHDLPIKSQEEIHRYFEMNEKNYVAFYRPEMKYDTLFDYKIYHIPFKKYVLIRLSRRIQRFLRIDRIKKSKMKYMKGSQWFSITDDAAKYVVSKEKQILLMFSYTRCPDEVFLQTILYNSQFRDTLNTDYQDIKYRTLLSEKTMANLRMIDWPNELGTAHPRTFIAEDYDTLMKCKAMFARKFDSKVDSKIIKLICQSLENG